MDCPACGRCMHCKIINVFLDKLGLYHVIIGLTLAFKCNNCGYDREDCDYIAYLKP